MSQQHQNCGSFNSSVSKTPEHLNNRPFCCNVCQISYYDISSYQVHVSSLHHADMVRNYHKHNVNKLSELDIVHGINTSQKLDSDSKVSSCTDTPLLPNLKNSNHSYRYCEPCNKQFSGPEPYQQHIVSKAHIKNTTTPNVQGNNKLLSAYSCETCDKQFSGIIPFDQHLNSEIHKKKVHSKNLLLQYERDELPLKYNVSSTDSVSKNVTSNTQENNSQLLAAYKCEVCDKQFSGPIPYEQHLNSEVHKKKVQNFSLHFKRDELPQNYSVTSTDSVQNLSQSFNSASVNNQWYCNICQVQCTGYAPYNAHITGASHMKTKRRVELEEQLQNTSGNACKQEIDMSLPLQQQGVSSCDKMNLVTSHISNGVANRSEVTETKQIPYSIRKESDVILSELLNGTESVTLENANMTFFRPDEKLNFDVENKKNNKNQSGKIKIEPFEIQAEYKSFEDCRKGKGYLFTCVICDVSLQTVEEVAHHFESDEHYTKMNS